MSTHNVLHNGELEMDEQDSIVGLCKVGPGTGHYTSPYYGGKKMEGVLASETLFRSLIQPAINEKRKPDSGTHPRSCDI